MGVSTSSGEKDKMGCTVSLYCTTLESYHCPLDYNSKGVQVKEPLSLLKHLLLFCQKIIKAST